MKRLTRLVYKKNYALKTQQILSITCDNASANDAMIDHLSEIVDKFPGSANRTRCFTHILNLVAKCIMKQFDSPKAKGSDFEAALEGFADDLEDCNVDENEDEDEVDKLDDDEDDEEIISGRKGMEEEEIEALEESVRPVKQVLLKVSFIPRQCCYSMAMLLVILT